jgi:hemerythrin-like domain-containing protein
MLGAQHDNFIRQNAQQSIFGLPRLEADVSRLKVEHISAEEVIHEAKTLYTQWPKLDSDRKRTIIESVFERIEACDGKIKITYSGIPTSEELCKNQQQMAPATG